MTRDLSYDVRVFKTYVYSGKRGKSYTVRWRVEKQGARGSPVVGARSDLSHLQRGLFAHRGRQLGRPALCEEALRLGRILAELVPNEAEVHGLVALMEIQASRSRARTGSSGEPVLLLDQNRARWDRLSRRGLLPRTRRQLEGESGPYALQAAIAACHARARTAEETDWMRIAALYAALAALGPSPIVELNRAVAVGMGSVRQQAWHSGCAAGRTVACELSPVAERARRPAAEARPARRSARCVIERAAALTRNETPAPAAAQARGGLRAGIISPGMSQLIATGRVEHAAPGRIRQGQHR